MEEETETEGKRGKARQEGRSKREQEGKEESLNSDSNKFHQTKHRVYLEEA